MLLNKLEEKLVADGKCFFYRDIEVSMPEIGKHYILPAVIVSKNGIIVFTNTRDYGPLNKLSAKCSNIVSFLRNKLSVHYMDITMFITEKGTRHLKANFSGNSAEEVTEEYIENTVMRLVNTDGAKFDDNKYQQLEAAMDKLNTKSSKVLQTRFDEDGNEYVLKEERWIQYVDEDPDAAFRNALYFGMLGSHMYKEGKWFQGFLYSISMGGFGAFWFMDCLQMLFGCRRVKKLSILKVAQTEMIYRPIVKKKEAWIRFAAFLPIAAVIVFLYTKLMAWGLSMVIPHIAELAETIVEKQGQNIVPGGLEDVVNSGG